MSNLIFACGREAGLAPSEADLRRIADRITPGALASHPHRIAVEPGLGLCATGPQGAAVVEGISAHLGAFAGAWKDWSLPGTAVPDGTFALVRADERRVELCSDFAGSRTLWYALTDTHFLASTSQRALVCLLGGLDLNRAAFAWFLSSGNLGPSEAWDRRLRRLPGNAVLTLDRARWALDLRAGPPEMDPVPMSAPACRQQLLEILREVFRQYDFSATPWVLPLSGGCDSRFILNMLLETGWRPPTLTWGMAASLLQPGNDAFVARKLAEHYGLSHEYLLTDLSDASPEAIADRFLQASGGTTDQLFPYLDGMRLWADLAGRGVAGLIRGDEGFGWVPVRTAEHARRSVGLVLLRDIMVEAEAEALSDGRQVLPEALAHRPGESIPAYRDRLYHAHRIPVGLAALNDVKAPFVEIASPLLAREVLSFVRRMPDALRTGKAAFREVARAEGPPLPYATAGADDDRDGYLHSEPYVRWLREELEAPALDTLLPTAWRDRLGAGLRADSRSAQSTRSMKALLKRIIPGAWVSAARAQLGPAPTPDHLLALRAALAGQTLRLLEADARTLHPGAL